MGNSIFSIGQSALAAAQAGLLTTSHNIANASTPGYSRQTVQQGTVVPQFTGAGFIGQGVRVDTVRRVYDAFLTTRVQQTQASSSGLSTYATHTAALDALFGDAQSGLTSVLSAFFAGANAVANNPADIPSRQVMLSNAQSLAGRFNDLAGQLTGMRTGIGVEIKGAVDDINMTAKALADLNREIGIAAATGGADRPPNDLLDQRDALLASLNDKVGATSILQDDGTLNVYLAHGEPLVIGQLANQLVAQASNDDPQNLDVGLVSGTTTTMFRRGDLTDGTLGGALTYRANVLDAAQDRLGGIAIALASSVNAQHALGQDLYGQPGGALFATPTPVVQGALANTGTATLAVGITSAAALTGSNYQLSYDGALYSLTRLSDNTTQTYAALPQTYDGITFAVGAGAVAAGDSFLIQPARSAAHDLSVSLKDPRALAAAAPIRTGFALANTGTGTVSAGSVDANYLASPLGAPVTLTYSAGTGMFSGFPAAQPVTVTAGAISTTYAAGAPVPYTAGATMTFGGVSIAIAGAPANGDTFTVGPNVGGTGDGRNALLLASLATQGGVVNGRDSLNDANGQLTSFVGSTAHQAQVTADAGAAMYTQAQTAQQSVSGVNLDEEAANLQKYQQAYQAAGKVMAVAQSMFDSILSLFN